MQVDHDFWCGADKVVVRMVDVRVVFGLDECNCDKYKYIGAQGNNMTEKESNEAYWGIIMRMRCMHIA